MQTSIFLAKLIGPILVTIGVAMLLNRAHYRAMADGAVRNQALTYFAGVLGMFAGLAVVLTHNVWTLNWPVIITLLGWLALVRGAIRVLFPERAEALAIKMLARDNVLIGSVIVALALGVILSFFGYLR
ncbi:MAG: hypothetical protein M3R18_05625 [Pseudomonadota bacterium]|nr:hypothetical protein [Pseudomonadota bacterium]